MPRKKRPPSPLLGIGREYLDQNLPEFKNVPLRLHKLDGPPGSPRYALTAELCTVVLDCCPYHVTREAVEAGQCPILECPLRHSVRLLLDRNGSVLQIMRGDIHWG